MPWSGTSEVRAFFSRTADDVDAGRSDVRPGLRWLGARGLLGADRPEPTLSGPVELVRGVAAASLADAFSMWSQAMVLEYLRCWSPPAATADLVAALCRGVVTGATALAPAIADLTGRQPLPVRAEPDGAGWLLHGTIPWASNLFDDAVVVTPARAPGGDRLVVMFRLSADGAAPEPSPPLLALNGTGTGAVRLHGVAVAPGAVLGTDLAGFLARCLPAMLLMQSALAVGLSDAALATADGRLGGLAAVLGDDHRALGDRHAEVGERLAALTAHPDTAHRADLARLRLDAMRVAADAVRLECAVAGGSGFRAGSATSRRVREAAFLPAQAPTEAQLRVQAGPA
jgi:alkylation response protein AidB-like acyl-CoA dehydrogenase